MRLWTLHPKYLDPKGLVAAWREGLLAKKVLEGNTTGYRKHPQLIRFKNCAKPIIAINRYLLNVLNESESRGYRFNREKVMNVDELNSERIIVTNGQITYEMQLLRLKLANRNIAFFNRIKDIHEIESNSVFKIVEGEIAEWEKI